MHFSARSVEMGTFKMTDSPSASVAHVVAVHFLVVDGGGVAGVPEEHGDQGAGRVAQAEHGHVLVDHRRQPAGLAAVGAPAVDREAAEALPPEERRGKHGGDGLADRVLDVALECGGVPRDHLGRYPPVSEEEGGAGR